MASVVERPTWVRDAVFYQIFLDRFHNGDPTNDPPDTEPWGSTPTRENFLGGDLAGVRDRLRYLTELGVTALYLTPIFKAGTNHRYDTHDYLQIDPALGDTTLLRDLVAEAHRLGIRVLLDGVFNHCGDGFWAFRDLMEHGADSPYRDWFFPRRFPMAQDPPTYQTCGGAAYLPKLNTANPEVRLHLLDVAVHWIKETDIDGWRLDVPWKVPVDFWVEFREGVKAAKPDVYLVGEIWWDGRQWLDVFDGVMNYRLREALLDFCARDAMDAEDVAFEIGHLLDEHGNAVPAILNLLGSHDTPRLLTLCGGDARRAVLALTMLLTLPGAPMLYYGDEIGLEGNNDPDCRRCMEWDEARWHPAINRVAQRLIALRHTHPALRRGRWQPLLTFNGVLAYRLRDESEEIIVVVNPRDAQRDLAVPLPGATNGDLCDRLEGGSYPVRDGRLLIDPLPERSSLILASGEGR